MVVLKSPVNIYEQHLESNDTNYTPLTPLSFIARTSRIYPNLTAVVHGDRKYSWTETYDRARRLASSLKAEGVRVEIAAVKQTTANILIEESDFYHEITKDDWFIYKGPKKTYKKNS